MIHQSTQGDLQVLMVPYKFACWLDKTDSFKKSPYRLGEIVISIFFLHSAHQMNPLINEIIFRLLLIDNKNITTQTLISYKQKHALVFSSSSSLLLILLSLHDIQFYFLNRHLWIAQKQCCNIANYTEPPHGSIHKICMHHMPPTNQGYPRETSQISKYRNLG